MAKPKNSINQIKRKQITLVVFFFFLSVLTGLGISGCAEIRNRPPENVYIVAVDLGENDSAATSVFYKIYLNNELAARTGTGGPFAEKSAALVLPPGEYALLAERWELNTVAGGERKSYLRANNIIQMKKPVSLTITEKTNRMEFRLGVDHSSRSFYLEEVK